LLIPVTINVEGNTKKLDNAKHLPERKVEMWLKKAQQQNQIYENVNQSLSSAIKLIDGMKTAFFTSLLGLDK